MTQLGKYHVLRFDKGYYDYQCESGLQSSGPWDNRPKQCAGIGCRRELVEQSTLDAAIESAATAMRDKCVAKVKAMRDDWCREAQDRGNDLKNLRGVKGRAKADAADCVIAALESLTLDQVKPGEL